MVFCIAILCLGVIGNIMVPIVILKTKDMRNSTNIFLTNLSIADLLVLLVCTPTVLVEVNTRPETWVLGQEMCKAVPFVELTVAHASVLTILAISFERYYAICEPLKAGYVCTKTRAILICVLAWIVAALFTSPILSIASYQREMYVDGTEVAVCLTTVDTFWPAFFFVGSISLFFLIPFFILLVLYSVIARHLMNNPGIISYGHRSNVLKYRKQVIFMLGAVVLSFFVCLLPFRALTLWIIIVPPEAIMSLGVEGYYNILYFCRIMLYLNSAMNPILYNLMSSKFREGFFKLLGCRSFLMRKKFVYGVHKGTFHTTSTNLSSSQSGDKRIHHNQHHNSSMCSSQRKRFSEALDESQSQQNQSEVLLEKDLHPGGSVKQRGNYLIKKCLVESTVINILTNEVAGSDLTKKIQAKIDEDSNTDCDALMNGDCYAGNRRRRSSRLLRHRSRTQEFSEFLENGSQKGIVVVIIEQNNSKSIPSPVKEIPDSPLDKTEDKEEEEVDGQKRVNNASSISGNSEEPEFNFTKASFMAAKESFV